MHCPCSIHPESIKLNCRAKKIGGARYAGHIIGIASSLGICSAFGGMRTQGLGFHLKSTTQSLPKRWVRQRTELCKGVNITLACIWGQVTEKQRHGEWSWVSKPTTASPPVGSIAALGTGEESSPILVLCCPRVLLIEEEWFLQACPEGPGKHPLSSPVPHAAPPHGCSVLED